MLLLLFEVYEAVAKEFVPDPETSQGKLIIWF